MTFRKSKRVRRNLRKKSRRNYRGGGYITNYILSKYQTNQYATPYTIASAIYSAEKSGQYVLNQNDWNEIRKFDNIYQELAKMYPN